VRLFVWRLNKAFKVYEYNPANPKVNWEDWPFSLFAANFCHSIFEDLKESTSVYIFSVAVTSHFRQWRKHKLRKSFSTCAKPLRTAIPLSDFTFESGYRTITSNPFFLEISEANGMIIEGAKYGGAFRRKLYRFDLLCTLSEWSPNSILIASIALSLSQYPSC